MICIKNTNSKLNMKCNRANTLRTTVIHLPKIVTVTHMAQWIEKVQNVDGSISQTQFLKRQYLPYAWNRIGTKYTKITLSSLSLTAGKT